MKLCMGCMESYGDEYSVCPHCGYAENSEPEEANQLRPGTILHNKYVVGKAIGHGAFGVTYLGYDAELERKVAIKEYMPGEFSNRVPGDDKVIVYEGDKTKQEVVGYNKKTQYSYRDYQTSTSYSWGDWTGWGTTAVSASDDREVNTRTMYRTRPRSVTYTYTYSKWGDWTGFSDSQVGQSRTREVRTKTLYRYKKK
ncbi:MAG: hypothetical protein K5678_09805 [Acetatifactor sp.]|nr:hypothetical protein [Acetatifactor sp.]